MIEKIYRIRVDFDVKTNAIKLRFSDFWNALEEEMFFFIQKYKDNIEHYETFYGNSAASPFIRFETKNKETARILYKKVKKIIKNQGGFLL